MNVFCNDTLITKTLLYNASLIIDHPEHFTLDRFFDFSSLCDASILFDELKAIDSSNVLPSFSLTKKLTGNKVINIFKPCFSPHDVKKIIDKLPSFIMRNSIPTFWENRIEPLMKDLITNKYNKNIYKGDHVVDDVRPIDTKYTDYSSSTLNTPVSEIFSELSREHHTPLEKLMRKIDWINELHWYSSPSVEARVSSTYIRRSIGYLLVAMTCKIDYFPDFLRIPPIMAYIEKMYKSLSRELYKKISQSLKTDLKVIENETKSTSFPIPPFTALILEQAGSLDDIPTVLLNLRSEFSLFRKNLFKIENELRSITSIDEKMNVLKRKKQLFEELSKSFNNNEAITFKESIDLAQKLTKPLFKPFDPDSYSAAIVTKPLEWIRSWWLKRPILPLIRIDAKVRKIDNYHAQIQKLWGLKIEQKILDQYKKHADVIEYIFKNF